MFTNLQVVSLYRFVNSQQFKSLEMTLETRVKLKKIISALKNSFEFLAETEKDLKTDDSKMLEFRAKLKELISEFLEKNDDGSVKELADGSVNVTDGSMPEVLKIQKELESSPEFSEAVSIHNKKAQDWLDLLNSDSEVSSDLKLEDFTIPTYVKMNSEQWDLLELLTSN